MPQNPTPSSEPKPLSVRCDYNFKTVWLPEACCFYEWARESAGIIDAVLKIRAIRAEAEAITGNVQSIVDCEYRTEGDERRAECIVQFTDEEDTVIRELRFPCPRQQDGVAFARALIMLAKMKEFPKKAWVTVPLPPKDASGNVRKLEPNGNDLTLAEGLANSLMIESFPTPPPLILKEAKAGSKLQDFILELGEHFPATLDHGTPVYGFFRLDADANEDGPRRRVIDYQLRFRGKHGAKREGATKPSPAALRLRQLGALRLRHHSYELRLEDAFKYLGHYKNRVDYHAACSAALRYFAEYFAMTDEELPKHFSKNFFRRRVKTQRGL